MRRSNVVGAPSALIGNKVAFETGLLEMLWQVCPMLHHTDCGIKHLIHASHDIKILSIKERIMSREKESVIAIMETAKSCESP